MYSIFNNKRLRALILRRANELRPNTEWSRVSASTIRELELWLRVKIDDRIRSMPSSGKTVHFD